MPYIFPTTLFSKSTLSSGLIVPTLHNLGLLSKNSTTLLSLSWVSSPSLQVSNWWRFCSQGIWPGEGQLHVLSLSSPKLLPNLQQILLNFEVCFYPLLLVQIAQSWYQINQQSLFFPKLSSACLYLHPFTRYWHFCAGGSPSYTHG